MKAILRHPLPWLIIFLVVGSLALRTLTDQSNSRLDPYVYILISVVYTASLLSIVISTPIRDWTILTAGLAATFAGDALLWAYVIARGPSKTLTPGSWLASWSHTILAVERTLFIVGCIFTLVGLVQNGVDALMRLRERDRMSARDVAQNRRETMLDQRDAQNLTGYHVIVPSAQMGAEQEMSNGNHQAEGDEGSGRDGSGPGEHREPGEPGDHRSGPERRAPDLRGENAIRLGPPDPDPSSAG